MARVRFRGCVLLLAAAASFACAAAAPAGSAQVLRSALLSVTATPVSGALALRITRIADRERVTAPGAVSAKLDGRSAAVTAQPDGEYLVSTRGVGGGTHALEILVSHDGIRELLTGRVILPKPQRALGLFEGHNMLAWWVLNVAVILIAVIAISRRRR